MPLDHFGGALLLRLLIAVPMIALGLVAEAACRREAPASVPFNLRLTVLYLMVDAVVALTITRAAIGLVEQLPGYGFARLPVGPSSSVPAFIGWGVCWLLVHDLAYYGLHRAQHVVPWLWRFHAVHHGDESSNATTALRNHPIEPVLQSLCVSLPLAYVVGPPVGFALGVMIGSSAWSYLIHLDAPLHWGRASVLLTSPRAHRVHHSCAVEHRNRNFAALFPMWDVLFGTYVDPTVIRGRIDTGL